MCGSDGETYRNKCRFEGDENDKVKCQNIEKFTYRVILSKIGRMNNVLQGLAGLLQGISRGQSLREILRSSPAIQWKTPSYQILLNIFKCYLNKF